MTSLRRSGLRRAWSPSLRSCLHFPPPTRANSRASRGRHVRDAGRPVWSHAPPIRRRHRRAPPEIIRADARRSRRRSSSSTDRWGSTRITAVRLLSHARRFRHAIRAGRPEEFRAHDIRRPACMSRSSIAPAELDRALGGFSSFTPTAALLDGLSDASTQLGPRRPSGRSLVWWRQVSVTRAACADSVRRAADLEGIPLGWKPCETGISATKAREEFWTLQSSLAWPARHRRVAERHRYRASAFAAESGPIRRHLRARAGRGAPLTVGSNLAARSRAVMAE